MCSKLFANSAAPAWAGLLVLCLIISSCSDAPKPLMTIVNGSIDVKSNPFNVVPLGALLTFTTKEACQVELQVSGDIPVEKSFPDYATSHSLPVLGLYADTLNTVTLTLTTKNGQQYTGEVYLN
ncbi:MAG: hypothetical protein KDD04_11790, partial [Sinomicrobium sp.]|nr:hypothetical protein [Sinomicrobium sp.]